jgi:hypothetical protein
MNHPKAAALLILIVVSPLAFCAPGAPVVGVHRLSLESGPNFVSVPLHGAATLSAVVESASATGVTLAVDPGWAANELAPRDGFAQYILLVRSDASESPGVQGDWWRVVGNGTDSLTVDTRGEDLTTLLAAGDEVEVRRLTSVKDLFGSAGDLKLIADTNFDVLSTEEDVIRFVQGVSFSGEVFYHSGAPGETGYYFNGSLLGTGDGSTITLLPNEPFLFLRKAGSAALDLLLAGAVLDTRFSHYLVPGANAVGVVYPVPASIGSSNLKESGFVSDVNFDVLVSEEDIIRAVIGTSFGDEIFHYAGVDDVNGWYVNGTLADDYIFGPTRGYIFFVTGAETLRWRQGVAFDL